MAEAFQITRRVEFRETDAAGIVHFSCFFHYMEEAEHALLRHVGLRVEMQHNGAAISWPRVSARCEYDEPAKFDDLLNISVEVSRIGEKSITYQFDITHGEREVAHGEMTAVCCEIVVGQPPKSVPIPAEISAALRPFVKAG
jgi:acyl-CoA thioester hydrolase